jgi:predicted glycoside hydrolase/deacetylase ChbG (UPF0249 family)
VRIIVNADDLGIAHEVNKQVFDLMDKKCLTSASVLINGPAAEAAVARSVDYPRCSFGVHLNITELRPLTSNPALGAILDSDGQFAGKETVRGARMTSTLRMAIFDEWSAQVTKARTLGLQVSHLDSHHYIHTMPSLLSVLKAVQRRAEVRKVRNTQNIYPNPSPPWILLAKKKLWTLALKHWYATKTTDCFTPFSVFHSWIKSHRPIVADSIELMTHPGAGASEEETALITTNWREAAQFRVSLINYHQL